VGERGRCAPRAQRASSPRPIFVYPLHRPSAPDRLTGGDARVSHSQYAQSPPSLSLYRAYWQGTPPTSPQDKVDPRPRSAFFFHTLFRESLDINHGCFHCRPPGREDRPGLRCSRLDLPSHRCLLGPEVDLLAVRGCPCVLHQGTCIYVTADDPRSRRHCAQTERNLPTAIWTLGTSEEAYRPTRRLYRPGGARSRPIHTNDAVVRARSADRGVTSGVWRVWRGQPRWIRVRANTS